VHFNFAVACKNYFHGILISRFFNPTAKPRNFHAIKYLNQGHIVLYHIFHFIRFSAVILFIVEHDDTNKCDQKHAEYAFHEG